MRAPLYNRRDHSARFRKTRLLRGPKAMESLEKGSTVGERPGGQEMLFRHFNRGFAPGQLPPNKFGVQASFIAQVIIAEIFKSPQLHDKVHLRRPSLICGVIYLID